MKLDQTDIQIINALQENGRATIKDIGQKVGLTSPAVRERMDRMEEEGVIEGYTVSINYSKLGRCMSAFVFVDVEPEKYDSFCRFCEQEDVIVQHYHIIGIHNSMLKAAVQDSEELEALLCKIKKYGTSQTDVLLSTYFMKKPVTDKKARSNGI